jgi:hypothetical protein
MKAQPHQLMSNIPGKNLIKLQIPQSEWQEHNNNEQVTKTAPNAYSFSEEKGWAFLFFNTKYKKIRTKHLSLLTFLVYMLHLPNKIIQT